MKKILALTLAAVMAAGMSTVAFATEGNTTPIIGIDGSNTNPMGVNTHMFILNADGDATTTYNGADVQLEGSEKLAIPVTLWKEGVPELPDHQILL